LKFPALFSFKSFLASCSTVMIFPMVTTDGGGHRDFYHNWTNSILQQLKRNFLELYLGSTFGSCFGDGYRSTFFGSQYRSNRRRGNRRFLKKKIFFLPACDSKCRMMGEKMDNRWVNQPSGQPARLVETARTPFSDPLPARASFLGYLRYFLPC
jgi:hypothetical protein